MSFPLLMQCLNLNHLILSASLRLGQVLLCQLLPLHLPDTAQLPPLPPLLLSPAVHPITLSPAPPPSIHNDNTPITAGTGDPLELAQLPTVVPGISSESQDRPDLVITKKSFSKPMSDAWAADWNHIHKAHDARLQAEELRHQEQQCLKQQVRVCFWDKDASLWG
ncbi:hypothetical protein L208DRAFT_1381097 [Tricholoma matsutake]|nr:hypothetical protein L208DRAFT_1381097 [Tricholoma matsutake 945]